MINKKMIISLRYLDCNSLRCLMTASDSFKRHIITMCIIISKRSLLSIVLDKITRKLVMQ